MPYKLVEQFSDRWCLHLFEDVTHARAWMEVIGFAQQGHGHTFTTAEPRGLRMMRNSDIDHRGEENKFVDARRAALSGQPIDLDEARVNPLTVWRELAKRQKADPHYQFGPDDLSRPYKLGDQKMILSLGQPVLVQDTPQWAQGEIVAIPFGSVRIKVGRTKRTIELPDIFNQVRPIAPQLQSITEVPF